MRRWLRVLDRGSVAVVLGLAVPVGVSAALVPFRGDFASPAAALVLVLVIVAVQPAGLPGREVELIVQHRGEIYGRFVMKPTPGSPVSAESLVVAASVADQVGAALAAQARSA